EEETIEELKEEKPEVLNEQSVQEKVEVQNKQEVHSKVEVQNKSEVLLSEEDNKKSKFLPQTGGVSTEATSVMTGMFLLLFGAMLFRRQKN
ncbi:LPXTG cell wall anchor domain-containing protein, partial [Bacillus cereus]